MSHFAGTPGDRARLAGALTGLTVLALLLPAGGCTPVVEYVRNGFKVGPNYHEPPAPVAADWIDADPRVVAAPPADAWWGVFDDPTLDSLIETARQQNLDLKAAATRVLQARAQRNIAAGNLLPQTQQALGAYAHAQISQNGGLFGFTPAGSATGGAAGGFASPTTLDVWTTGFNASWELDFWGRIRRNVEASNAELGASVEDYHSALVTLLADVATNYVQLRTFQQRIAFARKNAEIQRQSLDLVLERQKLGRADALDVAQAQSLLAQTEASIPPLQIGLRQAGDQLCVLLGQPPRALAPCLAESPIPSAPPDVAVGVPAELLGRRPDVRRAEREAAAQCARIGAAEADFYPRIGVTGFLGYTSNDIRTLLEEDSFTGLIVPNFQWKILNYGRLLNNVRDQDARFQELVLDYQRTVLSAGREVEDGLSGFLQYQAQARSLETSVEAAQTSVDKVLLQWQAGTADFNRVFTTQSQLVTQQDQLAVARGNIALSLISVYRALGGGWQSCEKGPAAETCRETGGRRAAGAHRGRGNSEGRDVGPGQAGGGARNPSSRGRVAVICGRPLLHFHEVFEQLRPLRRQEALRVELDAVQRPDAVTHPHDLALVRPGADLEIGVVERLALDDEAVVARRLERVGQAAEDALTVVVDRRGLAVHDADVAHHLAAEDVADALVAETDAQDRRRGGEAFQHLVGNAGLARRAGAGGKDDVRRLQLADLIRRDLIVAEDPHVQRRVQLAQALHEVVGEGVVVVDEKDHGVPRSQALLGNADRRSSASRPARGPDAKQSFAAVRSQAELGNESHESQGQH